MAVTEKQKQRNKDAAAAAPSKEQQKHADELVELREANRKRSQSHFPTEVHTTISAVNAKGEPVEVELHAHGGAVYLNSHGEARLTRDQAADLQKKTARAFQAVA